MQDRPNIIFILTDDQGYGDLGCTGNPVIRTPRIDSFHSEAIRMIDYHVGPTCAPTRAGLMTGRYANSAGVWHTIGGRSLLRREKRTLADILRENGYRTGIFGKWHLGDTWPYRPMDRGFDESIVHGGGGISQTPDWWGNDYFDDTYFVNGEPEAFEGYCTDVFFREARSFIEENRERPFFCFLTPNAPHVPYNVEDRYAEGYRGTIPEDRARFYGMISNIDENFGQLRDHLEQLNLEQNTILIFMTDNGTGGGVSLDSRGVVTDGYNAGMRGMKNSEYEGGHRVPFFLRWPGGGLEGGEDRPELCANIDLMPTLLDLCDIPMPDGLEVDGSSLKSALWGEGMENRTLVTDSQRLAYPAKWRKSAVMESRWRLVNGCELYDISRDPGQMNDIAADHPDIVSSMRKEYEKWWDNVSSQFDEDIPFVVGREPLWLTSHDHRNEECDVAWNQGLIRAGHAVDGYFEMEVEEEGLYEFRLYRWPSSEQRPIRTGIEGEDISFRKDAIPEKEWHLYRGGRAIQAERASMTIQGQHLEADVSGEDVSACFSVRLKSGSCRLKAWFSDRERCALTAAYYIQVNRQEPALRS